MSRVNFIYVFGVVLTTILAHVLAPFLEIHWIHVYSAFIVSCIFYNLLDFKFSCEEEENVEPNR